MNAMIIFMFLAVAPAIAHSWDCTGVQKGGEMGFEQHMNLASEIVFGKVTNGYLAKDHKIIFELETIENLKGKYSSTRTIRATDDVIAPSFAIGESYIVFLYGSYEVDHCGIVIPLEHISTIKRLIDFSSDDDYFGSHTAKGIRSVLRSAKKIPDE